MSSRPLRLSLILPVVFGVSAAALFVSTPPVGAAGPTSTSAASTKATTASPTTAGASAPTVTTAKPTTKSSFAPTPSSTVATAPKTASSSVSATSPTTVAPAAKSTAPTKAASGSATTAVGPPSLNDPTAIEQLPANAGPTPALLVEGGSSAAGVAAGRNLLSPFMKLGLIAIGIFLFGVFVLALTVRYAGRTKPAPKTVRSSARSQFSDPRRSAAPSATPVRRTPSTSAPKREVARPPKSLTPRWGEQRSWTRPPGRLPVAASSPRAVFASQLEDDWERTQEERVPSLL